MSPTAPARVRLLTYNTHGCIGSGGQYDAEKILSILREIDADFVALQEIYDEEPEDRQFLKALHDLPYKEIVHGITLTHPTRGSYGNIVLSKWPLDKVERIDLSVAPHEPRGAIRIRASLPAGHMDITSTHLGLKRRERARQVEKLKAHWNLPSMHADETRLFCLMGDINEWLPGAGVLRELRSIFGPTPGLRTFRSTHPVLALDRIYVRPMRRVVNRFVYRTALSRRASDHLPLVADVRLGIDPK